MTFDAIILGAGPAGTAAALTLAHAGRRAALLERPASRPSPTVGESLPPAVRPLLHRFGVLDPFLAGPHQPCYGSQSAWGSDQLHTTDFLRDPYGHGWRLDRAAFDALLRAAATDAGTVFIAHSTPAAVSRTPAGLWHVTSKTAGGTLTLSAPWLLDCTGRRSWLARIQGVRRVRFDRLVGHVTLFRPTVGTPDTDPSQTTLVEASPDGWWYTALIPDGSRVVVYLTDTDTETGRRAQCPGGLETLLRTTRYVWERVQTSGCGLTDGPRAVAAHTARLERCSGDGWLAAGDAALSLDPLSSQGLFHALASGSEAGQTVTACLAGNRNALLDYERSQTAVFEAYLTHRAAFYGQERRWPDSLFWKRRHETPNAAPGRDATRRGKLSHA